MNNEEAKFILQGYRPNGADAGDATFVAAIAQAKNDPALGAWFARQQAFDAAVSAKLAAVVPPADLRASILAGGRVSGHVEQAIRWWSRPVWQIAASLAVLLTVGLALWPARAKVLTDFALADTRLSPTHGHGGHGEMTDSLQALLSQPDTRLSQKLPIQFAALRDAGCRNISYRGHDILEICFNRNGEWFHCYIGRSADFPQIARGGEPTIIEKGGAAIAAWADAQHVMVVVSKAGRRSLEAVL